MLSVIIPTLNAETTLPATLQSLMRALIAGMIKEVIITDGGSIDKSCQIAETAGATIITVLQPGRGPQLAAAAKHAKSDWLLVLHADTELEDGWHEEVSTFINKENQSQTLPKAAAFTYATKEKGLRPTLLTKTVRARCKLFSLPYGDQGLLIAKQTYQDCGGFKDLPLMEDVDLIRRLKHRPVLLKSRAFTSTIRHQNEGYLKRVLRNQFCLSAFYAGFPIKKIESWYAPKKR